MYIKEFSSVAYPVTELTKKGVLEEIPWTEEHENAFFILKVSDVKYPGIYF